MREYDQQAHVRRDSPSPRQRRKRALAQWRERGFADALKNLPPHSREHLLQHGGETAVTEYIAGHRLGKKEQRRRENP
jgi:hypothetical protein